MIRFFRNFFILVITIIIAIVSISVAGMRRNPYISGIKIKVDLVKNTMNSEKNRIILVGGSNLNYGIDSELIENELDNEYEVINFGLHYSAGLKYYMDVVKQYTKEGDIIVLIPEYEHFFDKSFYGTYALTEMLEYYPKSIFTLSFKQYNQIAKDMNRYLYTKIKRIIGNEGIDPNYKGYNEHGDYINHLGKGPKDFLEREKVLEGKREYNEDVIKYINKFAKDMNNRGVTVLYDFPSIAEGMYNEEYYNLVQDKLKSDLNIDIIGNNEDFTYPINCFYDSYYHLLSEPREIRTKQLAEDLKNHL